MKRNCRTKENNNKTVFSSAKCAIATEECSHFNCSVTKPNEFPLSNTSTNYYYLRESDVFKQLLWLLWTQQFSCNGYKHRIEIRHCSGFTEWSFILLTCFLCLILVCYSIFKVRIWLLCWCNKLQKRKEERKK